MSLGSRPDFVSGDGDSGEITEVAISEWAGFADLAAEITLSVRDATGAGLFDKPDSERTEIDNVAVAGFFKSFGQIFEGLTCDEICKSVRRTFHSLGVVRVYVEVQDQNGNLFGSSGLELAANSGVWESVESHGLVLRVGLRADEKVDHLQIAVILEAAAHRLMAVPGSRRTGRVELEGFVAADPVTQEMMVVVRELAAVPQPILILGERGTGKELVARAIHRWSDRAEQKFVAVNLGAISRDLGPSEVFGYKKGAFTGADQDRDGYIQAAEGGTLFLDEIDEADERTQALLKRLIQFGTYQKVGDQEERVANVRIVAATNRIIGQTGQNPSIKLDLVDRFWLVNVPPLRNRLGDVRPLAEFFSAQYGFELPEVVLTWLETLEWPGNVRQLQSTVERACALAHTPTRLTLDFVEKCVAETGGQFVPVPFVPLREDESLQQRQYDDERRHLEYALRMFGGSRVRAANFLGKSRPWVDQRVKLFGLVDGDRSDN
jgi:DNA-binding NtrC family response regulator